MVKKAIGFWGIEQFAGVTVFEASSHLGMYQRDFHM